MYRHPYSAAEILAKISNEKEIDEVVLRIKGKCTDYDQQIMTLIATPLAMPDMAISEELAKQAIKIIKYNQSAIFLC